MKIFDLLSEKFTLMEGPPVLFRLYGWCVAFAKLDNQPIWACGPDLSAKPMAYLKIRNNELELIFRIAIYSAKSIKSKAIEILAYQIHASQWAIKANVAMSRTKTAAPYSEYRSIFLATRTNLSNLAVFNRPINVVVCS